MLGLRAVEVATPFHDQRVRRLDVFVRGNGREEIARVRQTIRADRAAVRQRETAAVVLADIGPRRAVDRLRAKDDAAWNDADFARLDLDHSELSREAQRALLRDDKQLTVSVTEVLAHHRRSHERDMRRHAGHGLAIAGRGHGAQAGDEGELFAWDRRRPPAQLPDRRLALTLRRGADQTSLDALETAGVTHAGAYAIEPGALIGRLWRSEWRAGKQIGRA